MARPTVSATSVKATAAEAFAVLRQRMRVAEEQASALAGDLEALGSNGQSLDLFHSKTLETPASYPAVSPVQARLAFVGENTLWKNCESLVNRMCWLESVLQTLKLNIFHLQMEKELNPKHAARLEQRLNAVQEEHLQEMKVVQQEAMKLRQQLSDVKEAEEKAKEEVQRLSAALEIRTATKCLRSSIQCFRTENIKPEIEIKFQLQLRNTKQKMNCRLQDLTEQLSQEISLRESFEESQATMMCQVQDMETMVEAERKQVQILQQDCQELRKDVQLARKRLQEEKERTAWLEQQCTQLKAELDSRNCIISQLDEEAKNAQLSFNSQQKENLQLQSKITALQEAAEKVQVLNDHLSQQCSDLSTMLQNVAMENVKLISDHQAVLKAEQEKMTQQLQEQDYLLDAACADILGELQCVQHERAQLQKELKALHTEHGKCRQKASLKEEAAATQRKLLESTVARLQGELEMALGSLIAEKDDLKQEIKTTANEIAQERNKLEVEKTENKTLAEGNKRLLDRLAALEHQQHAQQKVQQVLAELTNSKNKLAYDKGELQTKVQQLKEELQSFTDAHLDNSQLHKCRTSFVAEMAPKRKKSPARPWQRKSADHNARSAAGSKEETVKFDLRAFAPHSPLHRIHFEPDEHSRKSSERGDCLKVNLRILLNAIKNMEERLENKIDILAPRLLKVIWSAGLNKGDSNVMANLQRQLEAAKNDNSKVTAMLEHVLASHSKMQAALQAVQTELGHKDTEISSLRKDRSQNQQKIQRLETELEHCQARVVAMGSQHSSQVEPLCKALEVTRTDNKKLALRLEQALQANNTLQNKLIQTQFDLKSKETEHQQLIVCRKQLMEEAQTEEKKYAERLESLKKQFHVEREASRKATQRESAELKKAVEEASSKLGEVSRANRELRQKVTELEKSLASYKEKLKSQRAQVRHCLASKASNAQNAERIKEIEYELREMEAMKEQYQKKNYEQSQNIQKFVTELTSLQTEMQELLQNQHEIQTQNRQLETQLEVERRRGQQLENQCQRLEETIKHLKKSKEETEQKLKEASIESEQITVNLEEAHRWFKSKFDSLQPELKKKHQAKNPEESSFTMEEKKQAELPTQPFLGGRARTQPLQLTTRKARVTWAGSELT
ncbi:coiled-coil domain-containing protein 150 [Rhea pennata]|uniref:coiled-coil domain-containing protein 150 n=1 Tax=Rhea pennata TaxID=8795 RepID=UPI002E260DD5